MKEIIEGAFIIWMIVICLGFCIIQPLFEMLKVSIPKWWKKHIINELHQDDKRF